MIRAQGEDVLSFTRLGNTSAAAVGLYRGPRVCKTAKLRLVVLLRVVVDAYAQRKTGKWSAIVGRTFWSNERLPAFG